MEEEEQERDSQHFGPKAWPCLGNRCPHENIKGFLSKQGQENGRGGGHNYVQHPRSQNKDKIAAAAARQQQRRRAKETMEELFRAYKQGAGDPRRSVSNWSNNTSSSKFFHSTSSRQEWEVVRPNIAHLTVFD